MEKSIVLIDAENVSRSWQRYCNDRGLADKIDYRKLIETLTKGTNFLRAYFYDGVQEVIPLGKKKFHQALQHNGIQLRTKVLRNRSRECSKCGNVDSIQMQKGVDVSLATDIVRYALQKTCDICIVVSGDEDYIDAIQCAKDQGIKIWAVSFKTNMSSELSRNVDRVILLDEIFGEIKR